MKLAPFVVLVSLAACGDDGSSGNPPKLWLALNGSEGRVKLVGAEPDPY